ncbi:MAG TPA: response regulator transcription factor [Blastocatellia bacterium]|jgi:two-component system response regulator CpxR|nr:response regulator transcription factor [Blastocatellia bacterium]
MRGRILIIDDDADLCEKVRKHLEPEGFTINCVRHREQALACVSAGAYALILLDVGLPGGGGFEMLRCLRARSQTPVLVVTSRGDDADRILGLELGADDYLSKPCNPLELVARIHAILRRAKHSSVQSAGKPPAAERISMGDLELDYGARVVHCNGKLIETTQAEFDVLALLARSAGAIVSREELSLSVNGRHSDPFDRSIDMHVCNLRKKLGPGADGAERIRSARGVGYFLARVMDD